MEANIGQDIASLCGKCGESWHVVISKLGDKIAKVECKQCHAVHAHRDPAAPKKKAARKAAGRKSAARKVAAAAIVEPDMDKPVQPYSLQGTFEPGDRIQHPTFGEGVAQFSPGPGKIEILFGEDRKLLAQAKPASRGLS